MAITTQPLQTINEGDTGLEASNKIIENDAYLEDLAVSQLIQMFDYSVNFEHKDIIAAIKYIKEMETRGAPLSSKQKLAVINFVQGLIDAGLSGKVVAFLPFLGNEDTFTLNLFDVAVEPTVVELQPTKVDAEGLIGGSCRLVFPFTLADIAYRPDGQPSVGAGLFWTNKTEWPNPAATFWIVDGGSSEFNIDYWYFADNKSYVYIGGSAILDNMVVLNEGAYWYAQREGDDVRVYGDGGLVNFLNDPAIENKQLRPEICGYIRAYNDLPADYRTRAIWIVRALYDLEERAFNALVTNFKNSL